MTEHDDDLRRALHDAVADVRPEGSLDDIRSRTDKVVPMNSKRWILPTFTVAAVMALVVGGAFWLTQDDEPAAGPAATPSQGATSPADDPTAAETVTAAVPVYYLGDARSGQKLYREFQQMTLCPGAECLMNRSVVQALGGSPADPDYSTPWPDDAGVDATTYDGDVLTIDLTGDLHDRPAGMDATTAELAIQQLVFSAQAGLGEGRVPVQLLLDGQHTDTVLGVPASEPLAAADEDDVLAPVQITTPEQGGEVSSPVEVSGRAAAFEANVVWEVLAGGTVVEEGFATAEECCTLAPYSFTIDGLEPGSYTLVVHDEDMSGEGGPVNKDTKEFTVR